LGDAQESARGGFVVKTLKSLYVSPLAMALVSMFAVQAFAAPAKKTTKPATRSAAAKPVKPVKPDTTYTEIWAGRKPPFDSGKVRRFYLDGDFEEAIDILETALKEKHAFNHDDSVFFCKHLGVMYAAKYDTREKGKYYMHLLLQVEPTARILDMYASDMIYMIFKNIQDEFDATRMRLGRAEKNWKDSQSDSMPVPKTQAFQPEAKPKGGNTLAWVGTGTAVVAASVAAYFMLSDSPQTTKLDSEFGK